MSDNPMNRALNKLLLALDAGDVDRSKLSAEAIDGIIDIYRGRKWVLGLAARISPECSASAIVAEARVFEAYLDGK